MGLEPPVASKRILEQPCKERHAHALVLASRVPAGASSQDLGIGNTSMDAHC